MRRSQLLLACTVSIVGLLALPLAAWAAHDERPRTKNLHPLGHIFEPRVLGGALFDPFNQPRGDIHTDIAFWGKHAFQGNWDGFNVRDIRAPGNPRHVSRTLCDGNQGDVVVWNDVLVRSWNSPAGTGGPPFDAGLTCDGERVPSGFEGLHIFDISNLKNPELVGSVALPCGSHTATGVPDLARNRLLIYNSGSSSECQGIEIVEVPLRHPDDARLLRSEPAQRQCHDTGVILGDAMLAACAGGNGFTVWSLGGRAGGSLVNPKLLRSVNVNPVFGYQPDDPGFISIGHSAGFSWDGEVLFFVHEPGGGAEPMCTADTVDTDKSAMFFDSRSGEFLGMWTLPRPQTTEENCTIHNGNTVPLRSGRNVLVLGNYQAGTWVVNFTDPSDPRTVAWSDPPPAPVPPESPLGLDLTGAWSSYWYDGFIYETHIGEGLNVFGLSGKARAGAIKLRHLNPQTQEFTID